MPLAVCAQLDDFDDGDDAGWMHYSPLGPFGVPGNFGFTNGAYRIRTTAFTGDPDNPGRAGGIRSEVYSDFYIAVDVVNWDDSVTQAFGILARIETPGLGTTTGYAFTWSRGTEEASGDVDISTITGEAPDGVTVTGEDNLYLEPGKQYRFVFIGRGDTLEGRVYELPDTLQPKVTVTGVDATYPSGGTGLVVYDNSDEANMTTDATFDNYFVTVEEPPRLSFSESFGEFIVAWPRRYEGYTLQSSMRLGPNAVWTDIDPLLIFDNQLEWFYSIGAQTDPSQNMLFRLKNRSSGRPRYASSLPSHHKQLKA
jgi:hypothetical protein